MEIIMYGLLGLAAIVPAAFFVFYIVAYDRYKPEPDDYCQQLDVLHSDGRLLHIQK